MAVLEEAAAFAGTRALLCGPRVGLPRKSGYIVGIMTSLVAYLSLNVSLPGKGHNCKFTLVNSVIVMAFTGMACL